MAQLNSALSKVDLKTLIESMDYWEERGNQDFHALNLVKNAPVPPEDHEAFDFVKNIKAHFKEREKDIKATREVRQETATLLKAKLFMIKQSLGIDELFENAAIEGEVVPAPKKKMSKEQRAALELAEEFIKDLGVWKHYETFLAGKKEGAAADE